MWRRSRQPGSPPPQSAARVEAPTDADPDSQPEVPDKPEPTDTSSHRSAPPIPTASPVRLVIDASQDRVGRCWRVLLVDDRPERRSVMRTLVHAWAGVGTIVAEAASAADALAAVRDGPLDAAVIEIQLPVPVGIAAIAALRAEQPALIIVVCSFHADPATRHEALAAGADAYLTKPVSPRDLLLACRGPRRAPTALSDTPRSGPDIEPDLHGDGTVTSGDRQPVTQGAPS